MTPLPPSTSLAPDREPFAALERAHRAGAAGLRRVLFWQVMRLLMRLAAAGATAVLVGRMIMGAGLSPWILAAVAMAVVAATLAGLQAERTLAASETQTSIAMRDAAAQSLGAMPASILRSLSAGAVTVAMQRYPDAIAKLVIGHRAASSLMAIGPLAAAAVLAVVSWQAALLVLGLTPVMIIFFALVGETIRARADAQERALSRLAGQFADRIRTLPTILANHALAGEEAKLSRRLDDHVAKTMGVLRVAFLNAGLIDFFASLSMAMLAVFLGLGHLHLATIPGFSDLELWQSLFILMIAPEYFAPFRRFSEQYHAKAEGVAAAAALDRLLDAIGPATPSLPAVDRALATMELPSCGLVVLTGPSGSGKSTLLRRLAGIEAGFRTSLPEAGRCIWISTDSFVPAGTLADAIAHGIMRPCDTALRHAAARIGLLDDALLPGGLAAPIDQGGANLSGGQRLRIATARALLSDRTVLADEPTAKLDPATAAAVRGALADMARTRLVVVASHDRDLIALAGHRIDLAGQGALEVAA